MATSQKRPRKPLKPARPRKKVLTSTQVTKHAGDDKSTKESAPLEAEPKVDERYGNTLITVLACARVLQNKLLDASEGPKSRDIGSLSRSITKLEGLEDLGARIIRGTKIHQVLKAILRLENIPKEEEFQFKARSQALLDKYNAQLAIEGGDPPSPPSPPSVPANEHKPPLLPAFVLETLPAGHMLSPVQLEWLHHQDHVAVAPLCHPPSVAPAAGDTPRTLAESAELAEHAIRGFMSGLGANEDLAQALRAREAALRDKAAELDERAGLVAAQRSKASCREDKVSRREELVSRREDVVWGRERLLEQREERLRAREEVMWEREKLVEQREERLRPREDVMWEQKACGAA